MPCWIFCNVGDYRNQHDSAVAEVHTPPEENKLSFNTGTGRFISFDIFLLFSFHNNFLFLDAKASLFFPIRTLNTFNSFQGIKVSRTQGPSQTKALFKCQGIATHGHRALSLVLQRLKIIISLIPCTKSY